LANVHIERIPITKRENHYWTSREILEWFVRAAHRTQSLVRENAYDLCHCWGGWPSGLIGSQHRSRMPYAVALRGSDVPGYNARLRVLDPMFLRPVSRPVWRNAAAVTCVSRFLRDLARETEPDIPYEVIHNGVDCSRFQPGPPPERFTFLFVGRLIQRKGVADLLEAFRTFARDVREPILRIVGGGPESARLAALHQDDALKQRVFFHGPADPESIPAVYRGASVFVMPSIEEAMSNATLEAMASGLPVITTRTGVSEIIDGNGIVVAKQSQSELVEAMHRYLAEPALASEHGRRSREIAETMTWGAVAKAYRDTYGRILSRATL
jgi:glycosyltransferase involved in cell wall biosynthesis